MKANAKLKFGKVVLANAVVQCKSREGSHVVNVKTDDNGAFTFEQVRPGLYDLGIVHENVSYKALVSLYRGGDQHTINVDKI